MPSVSHNSLRVNFFSDFDGKSVSPFFKSDTHQSHNQRNRPRHRQLFAHKRIINADRAVVENHHPDKKEQNADKSRCQSFVFSVSVIVVFVLRFCAEFYKSHHHKIRQKIRQRMNGVGNHSRRAAQNSGGKLC